MLRIEIKDDNLIREISQYAEAQKQSPERFALRLVERGVNVRQVETVAGREDTSAHTEAVVSPETCELPEVSCAVAG